MKRFVIRNYGPSRQVHYKGIGHCLSNDQSIETNDAKMAAAFAEEEQIHVTDRGEEIGTVSEQESKQQETQAEIADGEISYDELTVKELRALCEDRSLKCVKLKKASMIEKKVAMIELLEAYDEEAVLEKEPAEENAIA